LAIRKTINEGIADRFITTKDDFKLASSLLLEAIGSLHLPKIYRLDSADSESNIEVDDRMVALHLSGFCKEFSKFNVYGKFCSHWLHKEHVVDAHGRSRFAQEHGAREFDKFETWLFVNRPRLT
jgi:hypothetical protein